MQQVPSVCPAAATPGAPGWNPKARRHGSLWRLGALGSGEPSFLPPFKESLDYLTPTTTPCGFSRKPPRLVPPTPHTPTSFPLPLILIYVDFPYPPLLFPRP